MTTRTQKTLISAGKLLHGGSPLSPFLAPQRPNHTMDDPKSAHKVLRSGITHADCFLNC